MHWGSLFSGLFAFLMLPFFLVFLKGWGVFDLLYLFLDTREEVFCFNFELGCIVRLDQFFLGLG